MTASCVLSRAPFSDFASGALAVATLLVGIGLAGCGSSESAPPPPPSVTVMTPVTRSVVEWDEFSGHLESPRVVQVNARVSGFITEAPYTEGSIVNAGDVLFVIDDRPYRAELASRDAEVARAEASLAQADVQFKRYAAIRESKAISAQDYDQARASLRQAQAGVAAAKAARELAALNLQWTKVTASITGRVGRKLVTEGNLVNGGEGDTTELTTITSIDPLFCYVDVPERAYLRYQELSRQRDPQAQSAVGMPCTVGIGSAGVGTAQELPHDCLIDFVDNRIDRGTGTIQVRGVITNPDGALTPGSFARLRIPASSSYQALLVPDASIGTDQNSRYVLVVDEKNVVQSKRVTIGAVFGAMRAVTEGLTPSDRVVTNGMQLARAGAAVAPQDAEPSAEQLASLQPYLAGSSALGGESRAALRAAPAPIGGTEGSPR